MSAPSKPSKFSQGFALLCGVLCLWLGVDSALASYDTGHFQFSYRDFTTTGVVAASQMLFCFVAGAYLIGTSVRRWEDL